MLPPENSDAPLYFYFRRSKLGLAEIKICRNLWCAMLKTASSGTVRNTIYGICLGLPKYAANKVLVLEAALPPLLYKYQLLTVQAFARVVGSSEIHQAVSSYLSLKCNMFRHWRRSQIPQIVFSYSLFLRLQVLLLRI